MTQPDAWRMIRRRAVAAGIHAPIGNHSFRATGITAYLAMAARSSTRRKWRRMKARARRSFTTERRSGLRRTRWRGSGCSSWSSLKRGAHGATGNHSFRATEITVFRKLGGSLENAALMANHASTRTTQLYDNRRSDDVTLNEVERIRF